MATTETVERWENPWTASARRFGYTEEIPLNGRRSGWSELEMHCRITNKPGKRALVRPGNHGYAYVEFEDGTWSEGCFHLFADSFSLS